MSDKIDKRVNPNRLLLPWRIKKWKPIYDLMLTLQVKGHTNIEIAEITGYTPVGVGLILRSPLAVQKIKELSTALQSSMLETIEDQLNALKTKAVRNISEVLDSQTAMARSPIAVASLSMQFLKGLGTLSDKPAAVVNNNNQTNITVEGHAQFNNSLTPEIINKLVDGLARADEARLLNASTDK